MMSRLRKTYWVVYLMHNECPHLSTMELIDSRWITDKEDTANKICEWMNKPRDASANCFIKYDCECKTYKVARLSHPSELKTKRKERMKKFRPIYTNHLYPEAIINEFTKNKLDEDSAWYKNIREFAKEIESKYLRSEVDFS